MDSRGLRVLYRVYPQNEITNVHSIAFGDFRRLRNFSPIDVGTVGAAQIRHDEDAIAIGNPRMLLRNVSLDEGEVVALNSTNSELIGRKGLTPLRATLLADNNRK